MAGRHIIGKEVQLSNGVITKLMDLDMGMYMLACESVSGAVLTERLLVND